MKRLTAIVTVFFLFQSMVIAGGDPGASTKSGGSFGSKLQPKPYFGVSIGNVELDSFSNDDTGFKLFGGAYLNKNFGVEAGYADLGEYGSTEVDGFYIAAVGKYPVNNKIDVIGKLGFMRWSSEAPIGDDDGTDPLIGIGATYKINNKMKILVDYHQVEVDNNDNDMFAIGVQFKLK